MMLQPRVPRPRALAPHPSTPTTSAHPRGGPTGHARAAGPLLVLLCGLACAKVQPPRPAPVVPVLPPRPPAATPERPPVFYSLMVESHDLGAEILLNDVLIEIVDPADHATLNSAINLWVLPGENRLDIRSAHDRARAGVQHMLRVRVGRRGIDAGHDDVLADFNLVTPDAGATFAETRLFKADPAPPAALWAHAKPLTLDDATRAAAAGIVRDLERTFDRRDVKAATALLEWKTVDGAQAAFRDPDLARANLSESLQNLFEDAGYVVDHVNPDTLQMELRAGGRLLSVARPTGPALQVRLSQGGRFRLSILIANVDGVLRIVR
jgi:hypothetical protein